MTIQEKNKLSLANLSILHKISEALIGVKELEMDNTIDNEIQKFYEALPTLLQDSLANAINLCGGRIIPVLYLKSFHKLINLSVESQIDLFSKMSMSRIGLFRTLVVATKSILGWAFYAREEVWSELEIPGKTIGREEEIILLIHPPKEEN